MKRGEGNRATQAHAEATSVAAARLVACPVAPSVETDGRPTLVKHASRGFTLLEVLVVIILIGIVATAVSVSVAQGLTSARVNAASGEMAATLRATRTQAIVQGKEQTFDVDTRNYTYKGAGGRETRLPKGMTLGVTSASEDAIDNHIARIRFFPDGSSTGGHITLHQQKRQWLVNVSWLTGAVSVVVE